MNSGEIPWMRQRATTIAMVITRHRLHAPEIQSGCLP